MPGAKPEGLIADGQRNSLCRRDSNAPEELFKQLPGAGSESAIALQGLEPAPHRRACGVVAVSRNQLPGEAFHRIGGQDAPRGGTTPTFSCELSIAQGIIHSIGNLPQNKDVLFVLRKCCFPAALRCQGTTWRTTESSQGGSWTRLNSQLSTNPRCGRDYPVRRLPDTLHERGFALGFCATAQGGQTLLSGSHPSISCSEINSQLSLRRSSISSSRTPSSSAL
jgi:hypothetical protein